MLDETEKALSAEGAFSEMSSAGCCLDNSENSQPRQNTQEENRLTCASMRTAELRDGLIRQITRTTAIGAQAQAALYDGDDEVALACLRLHWRVTFATIGPLAAELAALRRAEAPP
jgi:hypothetical protein